MSNITYISDRRTPLGTFHAVTCRDHSSLEHDNQPYFECNELSTNTGRREVEVLFADGTWLLADPDTDLVEESGNRPVGS